MHQDLNVLRTHSNRPLDLEVLPDKEAHTCSLLYIDSSERNCFHGTKAHLILKIDKFTQTDIHSLTERVMIPENDAYFVAPFGVNCDPDFITVRTLVLNRKDLNERHRFIYVGDPTDPEYEVFLLYAFPSPCSIYSNHMLQDCSAESMRRISFRHSLSSNAKLYNKVGVLIDSLTQVNEKILQSLYNLSDRFGFKLYMFSIEKLEDFKLGNYPDIDAFINIKCYFCFEWRKRFIKPILSYYDFVSGLLDCFWEYSYGDYYSLLFHQGLELLNPRVQGYIQNQASDFTAVYHCDSESTNCKETTIEKGIFGVPRSYHFLL